MSKNNHIRWILPITLFFCSACPAGEWYISATTDPITDKAVYSIWTFGSELSCRTGSYNPKFAVRIEPTGFDESSQQMLFNPDVFIWSPAIKRPSRPASVNMTVRFDCETPVSNVWVGSDNTCTLFCDDPKSTFAQLSRSKKIVMRFTVNSIEHTTTIDLENFSAQFQQVETAYLKSIGKHKPPAKEKSNKQCSRCRGKKELDSWIACPNCGGNVMSGGTRCKTCIRSIKTGKIRKKVPCPECSFKKSNAGASHASPGERRAMRNHIRNQVNAATEAESDAIVYGYYDDAKKWLLSKRLPTK